MALEVLSALIFSGFVAYEVRQLDQVSMEGFPARFWLLEINEGGLNRSCEGTPDLYFLTLSALFDLSPEAPSIDAGVLSQVRGNEILVENTVSTIPTFRSIRAIRQPPRTQWRPCPWLFSYLLSFSSSAPTFEPNSNHSRLSISGQFDRVPLL